MKTPASTKLLCGLLILIGLISRGQTINTNNEVGTLEGSLSINPDGSATYSIPLPILPGRGGLEPSLSLVYNSMTGNGSLGMGLSLSGIQSISRKGTNLYFEEVIDGVDFDGNDTYYLNGQRLIEIQPGEYRTEQDGISKIFALGSAGSGPQQFLVYEKSGLELQFGATMDSRIEAEGRQDVLFWRLNRVMDKQGNYIDYFYDEAGHDGLISKIEYTGNMRTEQQAFNSILFSYVSRADNNLFFISGGSIQQNSLLDKIEIRCHNELVKSYQMTYDETDLYPRLSEIQYSGRDGSHLNPTIFGWGEQTAEFDFDWASFDNEEWTGFDLDMHSEEFTYGDFDGNGKTDILCLYTADEGSGFTDAIVLFYSNFEGTEFTPVFDYALNFKLLNAGISFIIAGEFNGDSRTDLALFHLSGHLAKSYSIMTSEIDGFSQWKWHRFENGSDHDFIYVDLNGNGKGELVILSYDVLHHDNVYRSYFKVIEFDEDATPFASEFHLTSGHGEEGYYFEHTETNLLPFQIGDFTGDGRTDVIVNKGPGQTILLQYSEQDSLLIPVNNSNLNYPNELHQICFAGDFNGDGITDFITKDVLWQIRLFDGHSSWHTIDCPISEPEGTQHIIYQNFKYQIADYNGDGKSDIMQFYHEYYDDDVHDTVQAVFIQNHWVVHYSTGLEFVTTSYTNTAHTTFTERLYVNDDLNGDGKNDLIMPETDRIMFFNKNEKSNLIHSITNGLGHQTQMSYEYLTQNQIYEKGTEAIYPLVDIQPPVPVVIQTLSDNGIGGWFEKQFTYKNARAHLKGKGFLGFQKLMMTDFATNSHTITEYSILMENEKYYITFPSLICVHPLLMNGDVNLNDKALEVSQELSVKKTISNNQWIYYPVITNKTEKYWDNEEENTFTKMITTAQNLVDIDVYGNSTAHSVTVYKTESGQCYATTFFESKYDLNLDEENWIIGRPDYVKVRNILESDPLTNTKITEYSYFDEGVESWPLLKTIKTTPNGSAFHSIEKHLTYDTYGNLIKSITSTPDLCVPENPPLISRTTEYEYENDYNNNGRFLTAIISTDGLAHYKTSMSYDRFDGNLLSSQDANGLITTFEYDGFGRQISTSYADGTSDVTSYHWKDWGILPLLAPENCVYAIETVSADQSHSINFLDRLGRAIRTTHTGLDTEWIGTDILYGERGFVRKVSEPYIENEPDKNDPSQWTSYMRSLRNNKVGSIISPTNTINISYSGLVTTTSNVGTGIQTITTFDQLGQVISIKDPSGMINHEYNSLGSIIRTSALGILTEMEYDEAGRQTSLTEPNSGKTESRYNNFGELITQTDHRGNTYAMVYDQLGRMKSMTHVNTDEKTEYDYYTISGENGFGNLASVRGPKGISYLFTYDQLNRLESKTEILGSYDYISHYDYNSTGKLDRFTYPSGYSIRHLYTSTGKLNKVVDGEVEEKILWQANAISRRGQLTNFSLGNGLSTEYSFEELSGLLESIVTEGVQHLSYDFDVVTHNLLSRKDHRFNLTEDFTYDPALKSRLFSWGVKNQETYWAGYNKNGNIIIKTDVTQMPHPYGTYEYNTDKPHAVSEIVLPTSNYMDRASPQNISYNAFNKIENIQQTNLVKYGGHKYEYIIEYGPDQLRKVSALYRDQELSKIKHYIGGNYEVEIDKFGNRRELHYISGSNGLFAIYVQNKEADTMYYIQKDHLGSPYCVTDESGDIVLLNDREEQVYSFDPWGRRRNATTWTYEDVPQSFLFDRGFTGHEHLDKFDLINMNGRCYDPWLGRFLSPDPFLQDPANSQNYNRYSYALNNPLAYVDPSGYNYEQDWWSEGEYSSPYNTNAGTFAPFTYRMGNPYLRSSGPIHYNYGTGQYEDNEGQFTSTSMAMGWVSQHTSRGRDLSVSNDKDIETTEFFETTTIWDEWLGTADDPFMIFLRRSKTVTYSQESNKVSVPGNDIAIDYLDYGYSTGIETDMGCSNCIKKEIFGHFVKLGASYISHKEYLKTQRALMNRGYGEYLASVGILTIGNLLSYTRYAYWAVPVGYIAGGVLVLIGINNTIRHNEKAEIYSNKLYQGLGLFGIRDEGQGYVFFRYYDAKTGNYLGIIRSYKTHY